MAKYLIHACPQREWYVREYLVPSMQAQGIENINVFVDEHGLGCLQSFVISSKEYCNENTNEGTWHLQDDVLICSDFKERTEKLDYDIMCGFACTYDDNPSPGDCNPKTMWWSFPCIRIPDNIVWGFARWMDKRWTDSNYRMYVRAKKFDDLLFKIFLEDNYPTYNVHNISPNLINHIDYLLGGSVINKQRSLGKIESMYWNEPELVKDLERKLKK